MLQPLSSDIVLTQLHTSYTIPALQHGYSEGIFVTGFMCTGPLYYHMPSWAAVCVFYASAAYSIDMFSPLQPGFLFCNMPDRAYKYIFLKAGASWQVYQQTWQETAFSGR